MADKNKGIIKELNDKNSEDIEMTHHSDYDDWIEEQWRLAEEKKSSENLLQQSQALSKSNVQDVHELLSSYQKQNSNVFHLRLPTIVYEEICNISESYNIPRNRVAVIMIEVGLREFKKK